MNWKLIIENTIFSEQADCIVSVFERSNFRTLEHVRNAPRIGHFCGVDVYKLIEEINRVFEEGIPIEVIETFEELPEETLEEEMEEKEE